MRILPLLGLVFLAGCSGTPGNYKSYLENRKVGISSEQSIRHCHGYGCKHIADIPLTSRDWRDLSMIFNPRPASAAQERQRISRAIAMFEQKIGPRAGTGNDVRGTFRETGEYQLDCVDESTNTTTYLSLLEKKGLLRFHSVAGPTMRVPIIHAGRWPHQTAVIQETATGELYAVDSWFRDNGAPADIISLKEWKGGWKPPDVHDLL